MSTTIDPIIQENTLKDLFIGKWISVKDEMPGIGAEDDAEVLAWGCKFGDLELNQTGYCIIASWNSRYWQDDYGRNLENNPDYWEITHWMKLPGSPK